MDNEMKGARAAGSSSPQRGALEPPHGKRAKAALSARERGQRNRSRPDGKPGGLPKHMHIRGMREAKPSSAGLKTFLLLLLFYGRRVGRTLASRAAGGINLNVERLIG